MGKDRRSKDQKRKAKLANRQQRERTREHLAPYTGSKYQKEAWVPFVFATEVAIYQVIVMTQRHLTNDVVQRAFLHLIEDLHAGNPPLTNFVTTNPPVLSRRDPYEFLVWNIKRAWSEFFAKSGPVPSADIIGVLRTLLNSIQAHQAHTGSARGYVAFLWEFIGKTSAADSVERVESGEEKDEPA